MKDLSDYRKSYQKAELSKSSIPDNPMEAFSKWFNEVEEVSGYIEVNAMTLSTLGVDGYPKNRVVLLKEFSTDGFVFYTNYNSDKGKSIARHNKVSLSFFWPQLERQVIIKGDASRVTPSKSEEYFHSRPRGSQLGAYISDQSSVIADRLYLEQKLREAEEMFKNKPIPKPKDWGGYLVVPIEIEFWQGRENRLHDRIRFSKQAINKWRKERLSP